MLYNLTVKQIKEKEVLLSSKEGESITWPLSKLPPDTKEGDKIAFKVAGLKGKDEDLAKDILNEILDA